MQMRVHRDPTWRGKLANRRRKTVKANAANAEQRKRLAAEMVAFEQRERFTLIKRGIANP
jgi:alkylated DNA nucleotide flippase Atl1